MDGFGRAGAVALAALALAGLTGCGGSHKSAGKDSNSAASGPAAAGPDATASATGAPSAEPSPSDTQSTTPRVPGTQPRQPLHRQGLATAAVKRCRTGQLKAALFFQNANNGRVNSMLALTNTSSTTCGLKGSVAVSVFNAANEPAKAVTIQKNFPGAGSLVSLKHNVTAFSGVQWTAGQGCDAANAIGVSAPGDKSVAKANMLAFGSASDTAARLRICGGKVTVGTLQPSAQGVNFS